MSEIPTSPERIGNPEAHVQSDLELLAALIRKNRATDMQAVFPSVSEVVPSGRVLLQVVAESYTVRVNNEPAAGIDGTELTLLANGDQLTGASTLSLTKLVGANHGDIAVGPEDATLTQQILSEIEILYNKH
jgi:hypothetical protein